jgi:DNA repair exonuclease SbcCD ATPase subunit
VKKIKFKTLSIQNFLSVGEQKLFLTFQDGITLITGVNKDKESKNGCGKTTILDALYWSIFGNTIRDIKKDKIVHNLVLWVWLVRSLKEKVSLFVDQMLSI